MADKATTGAENPSKEEIEITPEMLKAGAEVLDLSVDPYEGSRGELTSEDIAKEIFKAMMRAARPMARNAGA